MENVSNGDHKARLLSVETYIKWFVAPSGALSGSAQNISCHVPIRRPRLPRLPSTGLKADNDTPLPTMPYQGECHGHALAMYLSHLEIRFYSLPYSDESYRSGGLVQRGLLQDAGGTTVGPDSDDAECWY